MASRLSQRPLAGLALTMLCLGGCSRPACYETMTPLEKLVLGLPFPLLFTAVLALGLLFAIDSMREQPSRPRTDALIVLLAGCALPSLGKMLLPQGPRYEWGPLIMFLWLGVVVAVVWLSLRKREVQGEEHSWIHAVERHALPLSWGMRVYAAVLVMLLVLVMYIGTFVTTFVVSEMGLECGPPPTDVRGVPPLTGERLQGR